MFDVIGTALQIINLLLLISWLVLIIVALIRLRKRQLEPIIQVLWTIVVILIPILGPLAFFIVAPGKAEKG
jgi:hypothetical protein